MFTELPGWQGTPFNQRAWRFLSSGLLLSGSLPAEARLFLSVVFILFGFFQSL